MLLNVEIQMQIPNPFDVIDIQSLVILIICLLSVNH